MGLYEYKMLSDDKQWDELWSNGSHLENRVYKEVMFSLYSLHMFFVEVKVLNDKIISKTEFKGGDLLDKYSGKIN